MKDRKKLPRTTKPMSLRLPPKLEQELAEVAEIMGIAKQDVLRLAAEIGLEHLRRIDYSLAKAVCDASEAKGNEEPNGKTNGNHGKQAA